MIALSYYFARCDGKISDEEQKVIDETISKLESNNCLSEKARQIIQEFKDKERIIFSEILKYLNNVSVDLMEDYVRVVNEVMLASEGIVPSESEVHAILIDYIKERKIKEKNKR